MCGCVGDAWTRLAARTPLATCRRATDAAPLPPAPAPHPCRPHTAAASPRRAPDGAAGPRRHAGVVVHAAPRAAAAALDAHAPRGAGLEPQPWRRVCGGTPGAGPVPARAGGHGRGRGVHRRCGCRARGARGAAAQVARTFTRASCFSLLPPHHHHPIVPQAWRSMRRPSSTPSTPRAPSPTACTGPPASARRTTSASRTSPCWGGRSAGVLLCGGGVGLCMCVCVAGLLVKGVRLRLRP